MGYIMEIHVEGGIVSQVFMVFDNGSKADAIEGEDYNVIDHDAEKAPPVRGSST